ncbi:MAG: hypothetical protein WCP29_12805 [Acidobacteriota bacterium]
MGKLIRFAIVAVVLYGGWQAAAARWDHFQLTDAVRQLAEFQAERADDEIRARVVAEAAKLDIALTPDQVRVRKAGDRIFIDVNYVRQVQVLPWYRYPWKLDLAVQNWYVPGGRIR